MGLSRAKSLSLTFLLTALTALVFQNCSVPSGMGGGGVSGEGHITPQNTGGGSGDPYEGGNARVITCAADKNDFGVEYIYFQPLASGQFKVILTVDGINTVLRESTPVIQNQNIVVDWSFPGYGSVVGYNADLYGVVRITMKLTTGPSIPFHFTCQ